MSRALVFLPTKFGGVGLKQWSIINLARQIQFVSKTLASSSIVGFLLQTSLHTMQLEYGHSTNFLATNDPNISYFTREARAVTQSYPSIFKWPQQQHNITYEHKLIFRRNLTANTNCHYKIQLPLGAWITKPTTSRLYRRAGEVVYSGNALGQWASHSRIPWCRQLRSNKVDYSLNEEANVRLLLRHQIVGRWCGDWKGESRGSGASITWN